MFSLLVVQFQKPQSQLSYLGGAGVEGGQGSNDYNYGSYDFSMRHGTRSGLADEKIPEYYTGDVWNP